MKIAILHAGYAKPPDDFYDNVGYVTNENALALVIENLKKTLQMLREAGQSNADIAITNEDFMDISRHLRAVDQPELFSMLVNEVQNKVKSELSAIAKEYKMLIAANEYESEDGFIYNTTNLIDRDGEIIGKYRKIHIPPGERFQVQPGGVAPVVFKTDIGNIGFCICYDNIFPEHCRILALEGADIIIHQTQGWGIGAKSSVQTGEAFMRVRAAENSVYLFIAKNIQNEGGKSCIIDNFGNIVSSMGSPSDNVFITEIEPDFDMCDINHYDNYYAGIESTKARQLIMREPSVYSRLIEGSPVFNSNALKNSKLSDRSKWEADIRAFNQLDLEERSKFYW